jgi:hypothetical protein
MGIDLRNSGSSTLYIAAVDRSPHGALRSTFFAKRRVAELIANLHGARHADSAKAASRLHLG